MKKIPCITTFCLCLFGVSASADTFTLKDGTVLDATVLKESPDSYTLEIQVTKSIKDERVIAKADIKKIDREQKDLTAFEGIAKTLPTPDFLTEDEYASRISEVTQFLAKYPSSSKTKDAKTILKTLNSEAAAIKEGGIKAGGSLLTQSQYLANQYGIDARVESQKVRALIDSRQTLAALREFEDFDKDYRTTLAYGELAPYVIQVIKAYVAQAKLSLSTIDARTQKRIEGLSQMSYSDRQDSENAIKEETAAIEAAYQKEKADKIVWPTITNYHKASLEDTVRFGEQEITRLSSVKSELGVDGGRIYRELYAAAKSGTKPEALTSMIAAAKSAQIPERYLGPLGVDSK